MQKAASRIVLVVGVTAVALRTFGAGSAAQTPPQQPQQPPPAAFRSTVETVPVYATVVDRDGRLVSDLSREDFEIFDNDKPVEVTLFKSDVQPMAVVVMLDTSGSMTLSIELLKQAAEQFLIRLLPDDKARVGAFNDKIQINARWSNDRDQLITDTKNLDFGNGTRLWDAVGASLDELKAIDGRKVVLIFTDGDDTESRLRLGTVMDRARAEEVMIYAIGLESIYFNGQQRVRTKPDGGLRKIADETGGGYFELTKTSELAPTFTKVAQELHSQYVIGFTPMALDNKVHKLAVKMKQPGMTAQARRSYLAAGDKMSVSGK
jgi:Ca-activated chloride channel homolog